MTQIFKSKVDYNKLKSKEKESYNFHKFASTLAEYGYDCERLFNDSEGADFIAISNDHKKIIKLQNKSTNIGLSKKYMGKDIYVIFRSSDYLYCFPHDELIEWIPNNNLNYLNTKSWQKKGIYNITDTTNKKLMKYLKNYRIKIS